MTNRIAVYTIDKTNELILGKLLDDCIAPSWSSVSSYPKNHLVARNGLLYRAKSFVPAGNDPKTQSSLWETTSMLSLTGATASKLDAKKLFGWDSGRAYSAGHIAFKDGLLYVCKNDGTVGSWDPSAWETKYLTASGCFVSGGITASMGGVLSGNGSCLVMADEKRILSKGDGRTVVFASAAQSAEMVVDGTDVLTGIGAFHSNVSTYSASAFSKGDWTWYSGSAGNGLYVSNKSKSTAAQFNPSDWNAIDSLSSMFSSSNTAAVRNVRGKGSDYDIAIAKICGVDVYAPPSAKVLVIEASVFNSTSVVSGETVSVYEGADESGTLIGTKAYNGQPVSFDLTDGGMKQYFAKISNTHTKGVAPTSTVSTSGIAFMSLVYRPPTTFSTLAAAVAASPSLTAAERDFVGVEIPDTWTAEDGTQRDDPMVCTAVKGYYDANSVLHRGAKMERKYASYHAIEFCTGTPQPTTVTALSDYKLSTIRQYLNSRDGLGAWHSPKHGSDQYVPHNYSNIRGYMLGCSNALLSVTHAVYFNCQSPCASTYVICDTFFLDSVTEKYGIRSETGAVDEGHCDVYWKNATGLSSPSNVANLGRGTRLGKFPSLPYIPTHLRSPKHTDGGAIWHCECDGSITTTSAVTRSYVTPCCVIWAEP